MNIKITLSLFFAFIIHLQATAGELIKVTGVEELKPIVTVELTNKDLSTIQKDINKQGKKILALYLLQNGKRARMAVAGRYDLKEHTLSYTPIYKLGYEQSFEVVYRTNNKEHTKRFSTPEHPTSDIVAQVVTTYPLADTIPYNTLYFHVRFNQPMQKDEQAYRFIKVFDDNGTERPRAWRQRSFWLDDGKLLVLMIHPGRVKNGIHFESALFDSGKHYTIVVSKEIKDINGNSLKSDYEQVYFVKGEDRAIPKALLKQKSYAIANTQKAVALNFSEGMDHASVLAETKVYDRSGKEVVCNITSNSDDTFLITPNTKWQKGDYTIILGGSVYDFAANRLNRLFEIKDPNEIEKDKIKTKLSFTIK